MIEHGATIGRMERLEKHIAHPRSFVALVIALVIWILSMLGTSWTERWSALFNCWLEWWPEMSFAEQSIFLLAGAAVGFFAGQAADYLRVTRHKKQVATAVYAEVANRLARCAHDYKAPWGASWGPDEADEFARQRDPYSLVKFLPQPPMVFPSLGDSIALLPPKAISPLIDFYFRLEAWRRDLSAVSEGKGNYDIETVVTLTYRLGETLEPGRDALRALKYGVKNSVELDRDICGSFRHLTDTLECEVNDLVSQIGSRDLNDASGAVRRFIDRRKSEALATIVRTHDFDPPVDDV